MRPVISRSKSIENKQTNKQKQTHKQTDRKIILKYNLTKTNIMFHFKSWTRNPALKNNWNKYSIEKPVNIIFATWESELTDNYYWYNIFTYKNG